MNPSDPIEQKTPPEQQIEPLVEQPLGQPVGQSVEFPQDQPAEEPSEAPQATGPIYVSELDNPSKMKFPIVIGKPPGLFSRLVKKRYSVVALAAIIIVVGGGFAYARFGTLTSTDSLTEETSGDSIASDSNNVSDNSIDSSMPSTDIPPSDPAPTPTTPASSPPSSGGNTSPSTPNPIPTATPAAATYGISYTNNCYSPANRTIKKGDSIVFTNNSNRDMWPASDSHPTHTIYAEFDANHDIAPGGTYSFTFAKSGTWAYHDHSKPNCGGTITVQ